MILTRDSSHSWHEQDSDELIESCDTCITEACKALEAAGWAKESVKVIGMLHLVFSYSYIWHSTYLAGITNQRETAVVWSRQTGKPLCRAIVWDDSRTKNVVAHFEHQLATTGIEYDGKYYKGEEGVQVLKKL